MAYYNAQETKARVEKVVKLLNDKDIDMKSIKKALDKMGWSGWLFVERSRDVNDVRNVKKNYGENVKYLKEILQ